MALTLAKRSVKKAKQDPTSALRESLKDFEGGLNANQRQQLYSIAQVPDASSVIELVTEIDSASAGKSRRCFAARLHSFFDAVKQFSDIVGTFVDSNPTIAALVWGSVKLALLTASNVVSYFEKLIGFIAQCAGILPLYKRFGHLFPGCLELQSALCEYYGIVVRLASKVIEIFGRPGISQFLSSIWNPFESDFRGFFDELKVASAAVELAISLASSSAIQEAYETQRKQSHLTSRLRNEARLHFGRADRWREDFEEREARKLRLELRQRLSTFDYVQSWKSAWRERVPGTAEWLQHDATFQEWLSTTSSPSVFWCSGTMGVGKTIVASQTVAYLNANRKQNQVVAHCFCRNEIQGSLLAKQVLGAFAQQLLESWMANLTVSSLRQLLDSSTSLDEEAIVSIVAETSHGTMKPSLSSMG